MSAYIDNRQLVLVVAVLILLSLGFYWRDTRSSLLALMRSFFGSVVFIVFALLAANAMAVVWALSQLGLWDQTSWDVVIFWYFGAGILSLFVAAKFDGGDPFAKRLIFSALGAGALWGVFVNLNPMGLIAEVVLFVVATFVVMLNAFVQGRDEYAPVETLTTHFINALGWFLIIYVSVWLIRNRSAIDWGDVGREFYVPVLLTVLTIPLLLTLRWYLGVSHTFSRLRWEAGKMIEYQGHPKATIHHFRARVAVLAGSRLNVQALGPWERSEFQSLLLAENFRGAKALVDAKRVESNSTLGPAARA